jgi:hypothetical protein
MKIIDLIIGATLMNAMPHYVLGIWKRRMLSAFGFGNTQNVLYGLLNLVISVSLYVYQYNVDHLLSNGIYVGAVTILVIYFLTSKILLTLFSKNSNKTE